MKYTLLLLEGKTPKYCFGVFDSEAEAIDWAKSIGWVSGSYKVVQFYS